MALKNITAWNADIHYTVTGKGSPVVFIHGFAEDGAIWSQQVEVLQQQHMVIVPDLPGSGRSQVLQKENVSLEDFAECILLILQQENIDSCIMVGHSMGGYITLAFAQKYPQMLESFVLFHSGAYADDADKIASRKKGISFIQEKGAAAFLKATIPGLFYDIDKSKAAVNELLNKSGDFPAEALIQYYTAMINRPDRTEVLTGFKKRICFIMGQHDKAIPFQQSLRQSHLPQISYLYVLRHSAHMGMLEETDLSFRYLSEFLKIN